MEDRELKQRLLSDSVNRFEISPEELELLFNLDEIRSGASAHKIQDTWGGMRSLAKSLRSDVKAGIDASEADLEARERVYGNNVPQRPKSKGFLELVWEELEDTTLRILILASVLSLSVGVWENPQEGWMEGLAIMIAVIIVVLVASINNYAKEKQFEALNKVANQKDVTVVRRGEKEVLSIEKLMVGDLLALQTGDIVPVDGIVISAAGLVCDESSITGESEPVKKGWDENQQPLVISGSKVAEGTGYILVTCVGHHTFMGKNKNLIQSQDEEETPLEKKLNRIATGIGWIGFIVAMLTLLVLWSYILYDITQQGWKQEFLSHFISSFITAVTIIVVAVPEGLPLAVTLSLAYAVGRMKKENNLVRHLGACETMGGATNICSDKTGTLTTNVMTVTKIWALEETYTVDSFHPNIFPPEFMDLLCHGVIHNSTAEIKVEQNQYGSKMNYLGSRSECAILQMAQKMGYDYNSIRNTDLVHTQIPFSSKSKRMSTVIETDTSELHVYIKGASEIVLDKCTHYYNKQGEIAILDEEIKNTIRSRIKEFSEEALRTLGLAYKPVSQDILNLKTQNNEPDIDSIEKDLILLAIVGIIDPVRDEVPEAVDKCFKAGITVRMVTGDNLATAVAIAKTCNIIPRGYSRQGDHDYTVMEGKQFREMVGGLSEEVENGNKVYKIKNMHAFEMIMPHLKVLARSSPEDKFILVTGLKQMKEVVAVTGDGSNDAPALKKSDVGFAMHISGTQLAKDASDIILLDDNFVSIVTAVKWGRNIYDCIRKFLQFQVTVNIVALIMAFTGAVVIKVSPLSAVQMLWVNLIMDTFAALALATEPPSEALLYRMPYSRDESLLTTEMSKNIAGQVLYQVTILLLILFLGNSILGLDSPFNDSFKSRHDDLSDEEMLTVPNEHFTFFFNTFVFMQVFNEINCRKLRSNELNIFEGFFNNWLFLMILSLTVIVQFLIVTFGGKPLSCVRLGLMLHVYSLLIGMGGLLFGLIFRLMPSAPFKCLRLSEEPMTTQEYNRKLTRFIRKRTIRRSYSTI
jgi:Ca2+ transporting ATPase